MSLPIYCEVSAEKDNSPIELNERQLNRSSSKIGPEFVSKKTLDSFNVEQSSSNNKTALDEFGGVDELLRKLGINKVTGLSSQQVELFRATYGPNVFPESPMQSFLSLFIECFEDTILQILIVSAGVSLGLGIWEHPDEGWIEGSAILIAVFIVALVTSSNNYTKELQFRALEKSSQMDERCSAMRDGTVARLNPKDLVCGDIILLQAGDSIPADAILVEQDIISCNESALTGEPEDLKKSRNKDCFLLSSTLLTEAEDRIRCVCIGVGESSQWGKIKANLVSEVGETPLQIKLGIMAEFIGFIGMGAAFCTFIALVISIWTRHNGNDIASGFVEAFIIAVTIIVVAIPEGLPLAVTIALAYSTKKMYADQCFIRVLAACETMGNATNLCSDKTGTLTENRMTVVQGMFGNVKYSQADFEGCDLSALVKTAIAENASVNRIAYLIYKDAEGKMLHRPNIIGNKTEGALILMIKDWGIDYEEMKSKIFHEENGDKIFSFNSNKKRSSVLISRSDGTVRLYCKGASEWVLQDCTHITNKDGSVTSMDVNKKKEVEEYIEEMAKGALRTLVLAHKDFPSLAALPSNWIECPPDSSELVFDCVVGIIDPLRSDVTEAVRMAQRAGVTVRMCTGDNLTTACAIARQCGILTKSGIAMEGQDFRNMTPAEVDKILPRLQVLARSSPEDKYFLVTRLNGVGIPTNEEEWLAKLKISRPDAIWATDKDKYLPGYFEEWSKTRPDGGEVVGVTGDGTNDAPALKAANVGLAMGITGTKVAQNASDIVILDDKFSSMVRAIMWGRSVYDNIRKFLQFQITVNIVALLIVFIGSAAGFDPPLNAIMMLWVNLIMDTMGALALATEPPTMKLLERLPYKKTASLLSIPMWRNILTQALFQLALLLWLLFGGAAFFDVPEGVSCDKYFSPKTVVNNTWSAHTSQLWSNSSGEIDCQTFSSKCSSLSSDCFDAVHVVNGASFRFSSLESFEGTCLTCKTEVYVHASLIFNTFAFCQIFNEFNSRNLFDDLNPFKGLLNNLIFLIVFGVTCVFQFIFIQFGGSFTKTSPLNIEQWLITIAFGLIAFPLSAFTRYFFPMEESPNDFADTRLREEDDAKPFVLPKPLGQRLSSIAKSYKF